LTDEIPSSTTPLNWDDYPAPLPLQPALPAHYVDANAGSTSTRIAAQPDASARSDDARTAAQSKAHHVDVDACSTRARINARPDASVCSDDAHTAVQYPKNKANAFGIDGTKLLCKLSRRSPIRFRPHTHRLL